MFQPMETNFSPPLAKYTEISLSINFGRNVALSFVEIIGSCVDIRAPVITKRRYIAHGVAVLKASSVIRIRGYISAKAVNVFVLPLK
jgi:hypothetical protein